MLAAISDVEALVGRDFSSGESARAETLLEMASGIVRGWTGQHLEYVANDTVDVTADVDGDLWLPERPVVAVISVTVDGTVLAASAYEWFPSGQLVRGWSWWSSSPVTVVYSHGFQTIPSDIVYVVADMVRAAMFGPAPGLRAASVDDVNVQWNDSAPAGLMLTAEHERRLRRFRRVPTSIPVLSDRQLDGHRRRQWA
jgi:hypothetical protein